MGLDYIGVDIELPRNIREVFTESYELLIDGLRDLIDKSSGKLIYARIGIGEFRAEVIITNKLLLSAKLYFGEKLIARGVEAWALLEDLGETRYAEITYYILPAIRIS